MGRCCSKTVQVAKTAPTVGSLRRAIDCNDLEEVKTYFLSGFPENPMIKYKTAMVSPVTYSFCKGSQSIFSYLLSQKEDTNKIISELAYIQTTPLILLCENEYLELLIYFLPIYDSLAMKYDFSSEELSVFKPKNLKIPIHILCEKGNLAMIQFIHKYYTHSQPPFELDVHSMDDMIGNNGALYCIKSGNLELIKYMFYECKADFTVLNKHRENALVLAAVSSKKKLNIDFLPVFKFLIEIVKIEINENYEETLLILESHSIILYFSAKLKEIGIEADKIELEIQNKIVHSSSPKQISRPVTLKFQGTYNENELQHKDSEDLSISIIRPINII